MEFAAPIIFQVQVFKKFVPRLCGYCGGALDSVISVFVQLHGSSFNLEFETLFESIRHVVADLWQRKGKIGSCFENKNSVLEATINFAFSLP